MEGILMDIVNGKESFAVVTPRLDKLLAIKNVFQIRLDIMHRYDGEEVNCIKMYPYRVSLELDLK
jgi:hypothetical protein